MTDLRYTPRRVAVTGALGNLGWKLLCHLARHSLSSRLVGLDRRLPSKEAMEELEESGRERENGEPPAIEFFACDLADPYESTLQRALSNVDALVHFAAQNPYPEATWLEVGASLDMTLRAALASEEAGIERVVFASSNHVMGRYKDDPLAAAVGPGELTPELPPGVGTVWHTGAVQMDSTGYATAKFAGERICRLLAARSEGATTFLAVRIGWCQPGDNRPSTLSAAGTPTQAEGSPENGDAEHQRNERWFRGMWLSNRDFVQLFQKGIEVDGSRWPGGYCCVNGISNNRGMKWSLAEARTQLGYEPVDDAFAQT